MSSSHEDKDDDAGISLGRAFFFFDYFGVDGGVETTTY
jgi:hypothetical protein